MLEVICVNYYTFRRIDSRFKRCLEFIKAAAKTKSAAEKSKLLNKYHQETYEIFSEVFDANTASSIDWPKLLLEKHSITIPTGYVTKKIHVNTAIRDIENQSGLPLVDAYNVLSEFCHPNAGSKMLVVNTKRTHDPLMDALTIGDNKANSEAALFYIDYMSESTFYALTLALTLVDRCGKLLSVLDSITSMPKATSKVIH